MSLLAVSSIVPGRSDPDHTLGTVADARRRGALVVPPVARGLVVLASAEARPADDADTDAIVERLATTGFAVLRVGLARHDAPAERAALGRRLAQVCDWATRGGVPGSHRVGLCGTDASALPALDAAAVRRAVSAVVARRADVDGWTRGLRAVRAPTLLVVDDGDFHTLARMRDARRAISAPTRVVIADDERAAGEHAVRWLTHHVAASPTWAWRRAVSDLPRRFRSP